MGNSSSTPKITQQDKAVLQIKLQKDKLVQYQRKTNSLIRLETAQIKKLLTNKDKHDRQSAKLVLKRIKYQETLLENVSTQILNLENMISNIEYKLIESEFLKGLQNGNEILKRLNKEINLDKVENLMDEVNENIQYQQEIDQVLSNSIIGVDINDEIDKELEELEAENVKTQSLPELPSAPNTKIAQDEEVHEEVRKESSSRKKQAYKQEPLLV